MERGERERQGEIEMSLWERAKQRPACQSCAVALRSPTYALAHKQSALHWMRIGASSAQRAAGAQKEEEKRHKRISVLFKRELNFFVVRSFCCFLASSPRGRARVPVEIFCLLFLFF